MDIQDTFALITLNAGTKNSENCGANGLPVTLSSITLIGNFKALLEPVTHDHLVLYVDCFRNKHERVTVVFEHHTEPFGRDKIDTALEHLMLGLYHMHYCQNLSHGVITPQSVIYDGSVFKWSHWGLNTLTENGRLLDSDALLPDDIKFMAPERIAHMTQVPSKKADVWSFGLVMLSLVMPSVKIPENPVDLMRFDSSNHVLKRLEVIEDQISGKWYKFFCGCLEPIVSKRKSLKQLFDVIEMNRPHVPSSYLETLVRHDKLDLELETPQKVMDTRETYHLLSLASPGLREGPDRSFSTSNLPSIHRIPSLITLSPMSSSSTSSSSLSATTNVSTPESCSSFQFVPKHFHIIPTHTFRNRLKQMDPKVFYPLILFDPDEDNGCKEDATRGAPLLPLIIRENDFAYQLERILLFKALIEGIPHVRDKLMAAAQVDVNPYYRAQTWGSILEVKWSDLILYEMIDKVTPTSTDRQISVDIPRCHQYNDLLASPMGHLKLTRILKAWLKHNEKRGYVYWQGLDSLASPFVILNFNNEPLAFASFNAFINKYLRGFFNRDNSPTIQEYLSLFSHLLAFHDPSLFNHLDHLGFNPELYAIPWFLTMFTHVLPLHKTIHVWDTLLLGNEGFPLCIGLAILKQLRSQLLDYSFNDCILIFSDLPEINVDVCVRDAIRIFKSTPKSALIRGWVPLEELRSQICPQIDMKDLLELTAAGNLKSKVVIIDNRSPQHLATFGKISGAITGIARKESVREILPSLYTLLIIVNDYDLAYESVRGGICRLCYMEWNQAIPELLKIGDD